MEIKGSGNKYYEVNLEELTCSCRDWTCRRHNFNKNDKRRLCKHLIEALELTSVINEYDKLPKLDKIINRNESDLSYLSETLGGSEFVLRYSIGGEVFRRSSILTQYTPIVVEFINNDKKSISIIDSIIKDKYKFIHNGRYLERYYLGDIPIVVIPSNTEDFIFQSIYYDLTENEFIKLSSISMRKLGLKLTKIGFLNKNNELIDMNIRTVDEMCDLLGISKLVQ